ncbi:hypothetical protein Tco_1093609 [Tanacetum coccineum]|uniref:Uncharacterized protein n=1 Tax=Tanacetum coccineum TaxID=301880 RepID=A0ABQ5ID82_9ASTR
MKKGKEDMKEPVPRDFLVVHPYVPHTPFPGCLKEQKGNPYKTRETICMIRNLEKTHKAQEDERDMEDGWDITVNDVERLKPIVCTIPNLEPVMQLYMPLNPARDETKVVRKEEHDYNIYLHDGMMQPLTPQTVHITPPDDDYVAPDTNPIFNMRLKEFGVELFDMTGDDE